jgi:hypothetical protein
MDKKKSKNYIIKKTKKGLNKTILNIIIKINKKGLNIIGNIGVNTRISI